VPKWVDRHEIIMRTDPDEFTRKLDIIMNAKYKHGEQPVFIGGPFFSDHQFCQLLRYTQLKVDSEA